MQSLGGPDQTLGFILAAVGGGCVVGPLIANSITPGVARYWRVSVASAFGLLAAGYAVMAAAPSIFWILPATCIRAAGQYTVRYKAVLIRLHEWQLARVKSVGPCAYVACQLGNQFAPASLHFASHHKYFTQAATRSISTPSPSCSTACTRASGAVCLRWSSCSSPSLKPAPHWRRAGRWTDWGGASGS